MGDPIAIGKKSERPERMQAADRLFKAVNAHHRATEAVNATKKERDDAERAFKALGGDVASFVNEELRDQRMRRGAHPYWNERRRYRGNLGRRITDRPEED